MGLVAMLEVLKKSVGMDEETKEKRRTTQRDEEERRAQAVLRWEQITAAMEYEERAAQRANERFYASCPCLTLYWVQNAVGLATEIPLRWTYHAACCGAFYPCSRYTKAACAEECHAHHAFTAQEYNMLCHAACANLQNPCDALVPYIPDVRLTRPPYPLDDGGGTESTGSGSNCLCFPGVECLQGTPCQQKCCVIYCDTPSCDGCMKSCCTDLELLINREIRSLLCLFSAHHSCHPGRCCGPAPCYENMTQRHERWTKEAAADTDARTARFYDTFDPESYVFGRSKRRFVMRNHVKVFKMVVKRRADGSKGAELSEVSEAVSCRTPVNAAPKAIEIQRDVEIKT